MSQLVVPEMDGFWTKLALVLGICERVVARTEGGIKRNIDIKNRMGRSLNQWSFSGFNLFIYTFIIHDFSTFLHLNSSPPNTPSRD
jgi:hypothetical protein